MKRTRKNVYILGDIRGVYRMQNVIKFFADRPNQFGFVVDTRMSKSRPWKYLKSLVCDPVKVLFSDIIYVCILNVDIDILYALFLAKIFHKKIVVDYYISIYEKVVVDEKWFKPNSLLGKLAKRLDRYYYNCGTKVIFLNEVERSHYCELAQIKRNVEKEVMIGLCIEEFFKVEDNTSKDFNICWWGSYLPIHGLEYMLQAAKCIKARRLPIQWYFFGNNDEKGKKYMKLAQEYGIEDVCHFENSYTMKNGKLQDFLQQNCSLALGNFGDSVKGKFLMNNKVLDACAMQCAVLTGAATVYSVYFDGKQDIYMTSNNPKSMADKIEEIYNEDKAVLKQRIEKSYDIFQNNFTIKIFEKKFGALLEELL